jgi:hypothetical protein
MGKGEIKNTTVSKPRQRVAANTLNLLRNTLETKLSKFATDMGPAALHAFGYNN